MLKRFWFWLSFFTALAILNVPFVGPDNPISLVAIGFNLGSAAMLATNKLEVHNGQESS